MKYLNQTKSLYLHTTVETETTPLQFLIFDIANAG